MTLLNWRLIFSTVIVTMTVSSTDSKGDFQLVDEEVRASWSPNSAPANAIFESQLDADLSFISYKNKMFFILDGNHRFFFLRKLY